VWPKPYSWTSNYLNGCSQVRIQTTFVDGTLIENFEKAICKHEIIYLESPNTFTYELQDLEAVARLAKKKGLLTMVDNSYCSPLNQQPVKLGIDTGRTSATKFIGGHSDVVAGVVTGSNIIKKIFDAEFLNIGGNISR